MQEKKSAKNLRIRKVCIVGVIPSFAFQRAKYCALELHRKLPQRFPLPEIVGLLELDWSEKLQEWRQMLGREFWCLRRPVAVFFDNRFVGSDIELIKLTTISNILIDNIPRKDMTCLKQIFRKDYISYLKKSKRVYCYLDICVDDMYAGTLTFRLYSELLPRTCENFKTLCLGTRGPLLSYKGSRIHRIVKKGWLQGGDIQYKTGGGGFSIFCDPLEDESYGISHDRRGVISMANAGRHKNGSQFFITLQPSTWMDTHFVAFGQLIEGAKVLKKLESLETFYECPINKVEIKNCGKLDLEDVEDVDALYKEEPMPPKKKKKLETISEQIVRMIIEALTEALQKKVRPPDILADGDVVSKMNLQLYFQGFYSLPQSVMEQSAAYLRNLRRELFRLMKPSATEIVESLLYELQTAVFARMTTLDDMRETIGRKMYDGMVSRIGMTMEGCRKSYVRRLINQIVKTAENMVELVIKKIMMMKNQSQNLKKFQDRMQMWVRSFVLQETFEGDNYFIAERPYYPSKQTEKPKEGKACCEEERKKKERELKAKLKAKYTPEDLCCLGSQAHISDSEINLLDYFSTCRYDLKGKKPGKERMPLLDLIEISRYKLRWIRKREKTKKTPEVLCMEKKIRRWMEEVVYTSETSWLRDSVFPKDCRVLDHVEEVMYGAMTAGLLEMYFFMDQYLTVCGGKRKKLVTRTIYPEDSKTELDDGGGRDGGSKASRDQKTRGRVRLADETEGDAEDMEQKGAGEDGGRAGGKEGRGSRLEPCPCGHPCCDCPFKPIEKPERADSEEGEDGEGGGDGGEGDEGGGGGEKKKKEKDGEKDEKEDEDKGEDHHGDSGESETPSEPHEKPCESDETVVDINLVLSQKLTASAEKIDINSFKWMKAYILEHGCDLKTDFATRVHNWMDGELFDPALLISKHSLVTRASLLSLSFSLAELIKEENNIKTEIKDFIYDLWDLYFEEMFKEAALEFPPSEEEQEEEEKEREGRRSGSRRKSDKEGKDKGEGESKPEGDDDKRRKTLASTDICDEMADMYPDFDLERYCKQLKSEEGEVVSEESEVSSVGTVVSEREGEIEAGGTSPRTSSPKRSRASRASTPRQSQPADTPRTSAQSKSRPSGAEQTTTGRPSHISGASAPEESKTPRQSTPGHSQASRPSAVEQARTPRASEPGKSETSRPSGAEETQKPRVSVPEEAPFPPSPSQDELNDEAAAPDTEPQTEVQETRTREESKPEPDYSDVRAPVKKRKSPIVIQELVDVPSEEEVRQMPPYVPPFWLTFLTEMTKQALGAFARVSRLPRRLYLKSDSELAFDDKMKEWFEFNAFNPQPTKGREVMDFIALHHKSLTDLEDTARSFMRKKKYSELINRCTRFSSAEDVAGEILADAIRLSQEVAKGKAEGGDETVELFVSGMLSSAAAEKGKSQSSLDEDEEEDAISMETDAGHQSERD